MPAPARAALREGMGMSRFFAFVYGLSRGAAALAALALVAMVVLIAVEIALRALFSTSTFVVEEFVGYGLTICVIWSLGYVLEHDQLIRVNLLLGRLSPRMQDRLTALAAFVVGIAVAGLAWVFWLRMLRAWSRGTVSSSIAAVPGWIPEVALLLGLALFALQLFAHGLRHLLGQPSPAPHEDDAFTE